MDTVQRVAKNTGIVIAGDVIFRLISLLVMIYLARYLGATGFGKYSFVFAYLAFFEVITDLGLDKILVREMSRDESIAPKLIGNAYVIKLILAIFAVCLSIVVMSFMPYPKEMTTYVYAASITLLFISFSGFYSTIFQANLRMEYNIIAKLVFKVLSAGLILWIIFSRGTLMQIIIVLVLSEMIKTLINYSFSRKFVRPRFEIDFRLWKHLFKEALPLALTSVIWTIYYHIDVVMLSIMQDDAAVGLYSAAYKLVEPLSLLPYALVVSLFPVMSASFKISKERLIKSYRLGFKYLLMITLPIAIGTAILADEIIFLIYGVEFAGSVAALQILIGALMFTSTNFVLGNLLIAMDKQKLYLISTGLCAISNVSLNLILIPALSYNGAAIATVMTKIVLFVLFFYFVCKHLIALPIHKTVIKPMISGLIMGAFVYSIIDFNVFLLIPLAAIVYFVTLLALKAFSEEDITLIKNALKYNKK